MSPETRVPSLALVVIGRNPGADLLRLLTAARDYPFAEIIFADSASTDGSSATAAGMGARVVHVPPSSPGAAAARAAGTSAVRDAEWILYADSDMVVDLAELERIHALLAELPADVVGVSALTRDRYPDGGSRVRHAHERSGDRASYFGGAVVLRRPAVLAAGNWNAKVIANEELDLHSRLRARGGHLRFERTILVDHFTPNVTTAQKWWSLLDWRGRRYGAPGLAFRSALAHGAGKELFQLNPEPFVTVPVTLVALLIGALASVPAAIAMLALLWGGIIRRRGIRYLAPSYLLFPQVIVGMFRYGKPR